MPGERKRTLRPGDPVPVRGRHERGPLPGRPPGRTTTLSPRPKRPGRAPPGIPVGGNGAVDAAFPVGRGLLRVEGAVAAGRHTGLFPAREDIGFLSPARTAPAGCGPAMSGGRPAPPSRGRWRCGAGGAPSGGPPAADLQPAGGVEDPRRRRCGGRRRSDPGGMKVPGHRYR